MAALGFRDVDPIGTGEESGVDVDALGGVARVFTSADRMVRLEHVQRLRGSTGVNSEALAFSAVGFADEAIAYAESNDVALFAQDEDGLLESRSSSAERLIHQGWLSTAPDRTTTARGDMDRAFRAYAQLVVDIAELMAPAIDESMSRMLFERDDVIDDQFRETVEATQRDLGVLTDLIEPLDGRHDHAPHELMRRLEQAEALMMRIADRVEVKYSDVELDASINSTLAESRRLLGE